MPELLTGCLTKTLLKDYYCSIWSWFKDEVAGHYLTVIFWYNMPIIRRNDPSTKEPLQIKTLEDLEKIIDIHGIEIVPDLETIKKPGYTNTAVIDVDSYTNLEDTKLIVRKVYDRLVEEDFEPYIVSTGSKAGFHVRFEMDPMKFEPLKEYLLENVIKYLWENDKEVKEQILSPERLNYPVKFKQESKKIFLDLASLKPRGGVKAIGSVNAKTGSICKLVTLKELNKFSYVPNEVCELDSKCKTRKNM